MSESCCRLCQEYLMAVVINRSGIDSGEVDMAIPVSRFDSLHEFTLRRVVEELDHLRGKVLERIAFLKRNCGMCLSGRACANHPAPEPGRKEERDER